MSLNPDGGVRVFVPEARLEEARALLQETELVLGEHDDFSDRNLEDPGFSGDVERERQRFFQGGVLSFFFPIIAHALMFARFAKLVSSSGLSFKNLTS
jgi:hypothetical protein